VTLAIELDSTGSLIPTAAIARPRDAEVEVEVEVSLTAGCEAPLEALKAVPWLHTVRCHPCDEAIVRLLMGRVRCPDSALLITTSIPPGTLTLG
jgi:hypothetical protein